MSEQVIVVSRWTPEKDSYRAFGEEDFGRVVGHFGFIVGGFFFNDAMLVREDDGTHAVMLPGECYNGKVYSHYDLSFELWDAVESLAMRFLDDQHEENESAYVSEFDGLAGVNVADPAISITNFSLKNGTFTAVCGPITLRDMNMVIGLDSGKLEISCPQMGDDEWHYPLYGIVDEPLMAKILEVANVAYDKADYDDEDVSVTMVSCNGTIN